jgi:hypothetical protein
LKSAGAMLLSAERKKDGQETPKKVFILSVWRLCGFIQLLLFCYDLSVYDRASAVVENANNGFNPLMHNLHEFLFCIYTTDKFTRTVLDILH